MLQTNPINKEALLEIKAHIKKHSPHPEKVKIITVTKTKSLKTIKNALKEGLFLIGENKVQETKIKIKKKPPKLQIHMIGHLQSNKAKQAVDQYNVIQTIDSYKLSKKINIAAKKANKKQKILLQINISNSPTQYGATRQKSKEIAKKIKKLSNINLIGLMAIGPNTTEKKEIKEAYKRMLVLQQAMYKDVSKNITELSLGMTNDYILALQNGATMIRIGTKLFK